MRLPPQAALARLAAAIDPDRRTLWAGGGYPGDRELLGRIEGGSFRIRRRPSLYGPLGPMLVGAVETMPGGSMVRAHVRPVPLLRVLDPFLLVWLVFNGVLLVLFVSGYVYALATEGPGFLLRLSLSRVHLELLVPTLMTLFPLVYVKLRQWFGQRERSLLRQALDSIFADVRSTGEAV